MINIVKKLKFLYLIFIFKFIDFLMKYVITRNFKKIYNFIYIEVNNIYYIIRII